MNRILLLSIFLLASLKAFSNESVLETAWSDISRLPGFETEQAEASMFSFPESFGEGRLAVHPNASQRPAFTAILDGISDDYLLGQLADETFDERLFLEEIDDEDSFRILYTISGAGGTDTIAFLDSITAAQAEELTALWEKHVSQEEEGDAEEFEQDFSDE